VKERFERLKVVKKIIKNNRIDSQETLLGFLEKEGYSVTQATLSRDLKLLRVGKIADGHSGYYYTLPGDEERRESEKTYLQDFLRGYVSIDFSGNIAVIRTLTGHADSVAIALDNLMFEGVIGTVAGDDTVIAVLAEGISSQDFLQIMREKLPQLEI
jgi:transcriptional regulator of arginine metabolism